MWEQLSSELRSKADFKSENGETDGQADMAKFGVSGYPTFIFTDNSGKELRRVVGPDADGIRNAVKDLAG